jgi:repressor LexA
MHSCSPTLQELRSFCNVSSINTIVGHLNVIERKGYILRRKNSKRNIEIRENTSPSSNNWTVVIPVKASVGCDDLSIFTDEKHDEMIHVDSSLVGGKGDVVAVRAVGNSMNDADIHDGDYVLIETTSNIETGDRVAVIIGDMVTVKKLDKQNGFMILRPESTDPKYKPIVVSENFKIAGKVFCTIPGQSRDITEVVYLPSTN